MSGLLVYSTTSDLFNSHVSLLFTGIRFIIMFFENSSYTIQCYSRIPSHVSTDGNKKADSLIFIICFCVGLIFLLSPRLIFFNSFHKTRYHLILAKPLIILMLLVLLNGFNYFIFWVFSFNISYVLSLLLMLLFIVL